MCGICGIVWKSGPAERLTDQLHEMCAQMVHRGPDSAGYRELSFAAIGMRRLRIIDVTVDGDQPISNEDGSVWVVMNGEIYNFVALRDELTARGHVFRSLTDTEVIVHLWEELGPGLVARLRGMFAFAVVDERRRTVFLARDRLGIKPPAPGGTVRALRENGPGARAPNPQTLRSRSAGTARPARMGANHGHAAPQNPRGLRSLPRQHPREANRVKHGIVAGEPGDQKWSRRVVCPANDYVEKLLDGRGSACSARFLRVMRST